MFRSLLCQPHNYIQKLTSTPEGTYWSHTDDMKPFVVTHNTMQTTLITPALISLTSGRAFLTWDVHAQREGPHWSLREYAEYWNARRESRANHLPRRGHEDDEVDSAVASARITHSMYTLLEGTVQDPDIPKEMEACVQPLVYKNEMYSMTCFHRKLHYSPSLSYSDLAPFPAGLATCMHINFGARQFKLMPPTSLNIKLYVRWCLSGKMPGQMPQFEEVVQVVAEEKDTLYVPPGWLLVSYTNTSSGTISSSWIDRRHLSVHLESYRMQAYLSENPIPYFENRNLDFKKQVWSFTVKLHGALQKAAGLTGEILKLRTNAILSQRKTARPSRPAEMLPHCIESDEGEKTAARKLPKRAEKGSMDSFISSEEDDDGMCSDEEWQSREPDDDDDDDHDYGAYKARRATRKQNDPRGNEVRSRPLRRAQKAAMSQDNLVEKESRGPPTKIIVKIPQVQSPTKIKIKLKTIPQVDGADGDGLLHSAGDEYMGATISLLLEVLPDWVDDAPDEIWEPALLLVELEVFAKALGYGLRPVINLDALHGEASDDKPPKAEEEGDEYIPDMSVLKSYRKESKKEDLNIKKRAPSKAPLKKPPGKQLSVKNRLMKKLGMR